MTLALGAVYRTISGYLLKTAGQTRATADTGAVTLIQRFGSALNLNVHFHMTFLDGVYVQTGDQPVFRHVPALTSARLFVASDALPFAIGAVVAFVTALLAVRGFIRFISTHSFAAFAWYRIVFGLVVLVVAW